MQHLFGPQFEGPFTGTEIVREASIFVPLCSKLSAVICVFRSGLHGLS